MKILSGRIAAMLAVGGALALSNSASMAQQMVTQGWYPAGIVTRIHPGGGDGYFYFSSATSMGVANCVQNGYGYAFSGAQSDANRNFALLMMAYTTGKPISIHVTGACSANGTGRPMVDTVEITDVPYY